AVDVLQPDAAAAAALGGVAHDQVGVDHQAWADAVAEAGHAVRVGRGAAAFGSGRQDAVRRRAHDQDSAAVGRDGRVGALVEQDRVVLDVAGVYESAVGKAAAVTRAQFSADPVVREPVEVRAGGDGDAAASRRRSGEQLVADGRVLGDRVVVHVDVQVEAVRQLL